MCRTSCADVGLHEVGDGDAVLSSMLGLTRRICIDSGRIVWEQYVRPAVPDCWRGIEFFGDVFVFYGRTRLVAHASSDGRPRWSRLFPQQIRRVMRVDGGILVVLGEPDGISRPPPARDRTWPVVFLDDFGTERWRVPDHRDERVAQLMVSRFVGGRGSAPPMPSFDPEADFGKYYAVADGRWLRMSKRIYSALVGEVSVLGPDGEVLWRRTSEHGINPKPLDGRKRALFLTTTHAELVELETGRALWKVAAKGLAQSFPIAETPNTVVLADCAAGPAIDLATGRTRWHASGAQRFEDDSLAAHHFEQTSGWHTARIVPAPAACDLDIIVDFGGLTASIGRGATQKFRGDGFVSRMTTFDPIDESQATLEMRCFDTKDEVIIDLRLTPGWIYSRDLDLIGDPDAGEVIPALLESFVRSAAAAGSQR